MKKFLRWALYIFLVLVVLGVIAFLSLDTIAKSMAQKRIQEQTGMKAEIGKFHLGLKDQTVHIGALRRDIVFERWEAVFMEISQKYNRAMIESLAAESGFAIKKNFYDSRRYYCDSLWQTV